MVWLLLILGGFVFIVSLIIIDVINLNKCPKCKQRTLEEHMVFKDAVIYKCKNCGHRIMRG